LYETTLHSTAKWSPYHNRKIVGKIISTFVRGQNVYKEDGQLLGKAGDGRFIKAKHQSTQGCLI